MPRWAPDEIDRLCSQWAEQRRRMLGLSQLEPRERLGKLKSTIGALKADREGAGQGAISQSFPEVYIGPPPNFPLLVNLAWKRMDREWARIIEAHYVYDKVRIKQKAALLEISIPLYWRYLTFGKNFVQSYVMCITEISDAQSHGLVSTQNNEHA